jgi:hypothetical protein
MICEFMVQKLDGSCYLTGLTRWMLGVVILSVYEIKRSVFLIVKRW